MRTSGKDCLFPVPLRGSSGGFLDDWRLCERRESNQSADPFRRNVLAAIPEPTFRPSKPTSGDVHFEDDDGLDAAPCRLTVGSVAQAVLPVACSQTTGSLPWLLLVSNPPSRMLAR